MRGKMEFKMKSIICTSARFEHTRPWIHEDIQNKSAKHISRNRTRAMKEMRNQNKSANEHKHGIEHTLARTKAPNETHRFIKLRGIHLSESAATRGKSNASEPMKQPSQRTVSATWR